MTRKAPAPAQLSPELRQIIDDVTAALMTAADPAAAALEFVRLFGEALGGQTDEKAGKR
ncbi:hypothetical protein QFZ56_003807 [Streptomyces achromogenes]|uniref:Uncharacterized protein n=1 Tax=Streptomyces achromogenes TaxID=67255 RepID=A0ABU0Q2F2_STRAH|nr:hypothetical protein [Streptomyces achromogenes]MDQ0684844.1 hypothetical protein [Streptomyces achromogenes]